MNIIKLIMIISLLFLNVNSKVFSQADSLSISGEIHFNCKGDIYVYLVDKETFKVPFTGIEKLFIEISDSLYKEKRVKYKFEGLGKGEYGIRCYQDNNDNGKLDKGLFGPKEPWRMSWKKGKPAKWPKFKHISFDLDSSKVDLDISMKK